MVVSQSEYFMWSMWLVHELEVKFHNVLVFELFSSEKLAFEQNSKHSILIRINIVVCSTTVYS